ncbi:MAG: hypothetical protein UR25_C0005G0048 [Candidatus Nomurabacteria bacterium GW2011_GWE1_32_28]|uniref:Uncharacterized protein n=1 Tax=Candidatus Nomurabacteria bacterium GW2011_GWF1_31_48 TaxID=1618767 RepID=A0A0G0ATS5_9BACT|nr:MAG: hypothetical protein UR10_C0003G0246 [Candidatus Nomurabacteria bacterium GW2011_GWF2_30_133]KKP28465.1 MAG: hypothetical protein UR18_C0004G0047 [Candidatus Nomurabacteria bacterium GW2011_GWE2_31_40]KKP30045.1 MAG: hypothetical protein UR19_C0005G0047 [Candidatus Nomurabacteria bacterium GW2011_GWF1_31_48]KKP34564.1 MAG: hypothetical protein UR25_C0005G0048 [Candidatus Nomurabacteria bacterium GW2011_GWE1_32_28]HAS81038.1 hypothetical protein [Candidatus Nomurabacteria bacterium]
MEQNCCVAYLGQCDFKILSRIDGHYKEFFYVCMNCGREKILDRISLNHKNHKYSEGDQIKMEELSLQGK